MSLADCFLLIDKYGANHTIQRITPPGPNASATVMMTQRRAMESPLMGDVSQQETTFFVRAGSLSSAGFPTPVLKGDRIVDGEGRVFVVKVAEDMHDGQGNTGGYRLRCRGH